VQDHGIGISAGQQGQIFGRFARADNAVAWGISGTGLGLYICRELVERHGGQLWFESEEGRGSTFFLALPALSHVAAPEHGAKEGGDERAGSSRLEN
jgi:signal transduction histidine kinase